MNIVPTLNAARELLTAVRDYENLKQSTGRRGVDRAALLLNGVVFKRNALRRELDPLGFRDNYPFPEPGHEFKLRTLAALQTVWQACAELTTERLTNFDELPWLNDQQDMLEQALAMLAQKTESTTADEPQQYVTLD